MPGEWLQLNLGLARGEGGALGSARAVFAALHGPLAAARRDGLTDLFFFQRKPPDLRLRIRGAPQRWPELRAALEPLGLGPRPAVLEIFESVYEPELHLFGGARGMEAVHRWMSEDTVAFLALDQLYAAGRPIPAAEALFFASIDEVFGRAIGDRSEIWDAYKRVEAALDPTLLPQDPLEPLHFSDLALPAQPELSAALTAWSAAHQALAAALKDAWSAGALTVGLRALLAQVALFSANRHGVAHSALARVVATGCAQWDPHRPRPPA